MANIKKDSLNKDRIVPVTKTDLLTLYATMLKLIGRPAIEYLQPDNVDGDYTLPAEPTDEHAQAYFCIEPVRSFTIPEGATALPGIYFVPAYSFEGIDRVDPDGSTLYQAVYREGAWTVLPVVATPNDN